MLLGWRLESICKYGSCLHGGEGDRNANRAQGHIQSASESAMKAGISPQGVASTWPGSECLVPETRRPTYTNITKKPEPPLECLLYGTLYQSRILECIIENPK